MKINETRGARRNPNTRSATVCRLLTKLLLLPAQSTLSDHDDTSSQVTETDSRQRTSVIPHRSAIGLENFFRGGFPGLGKGEAPASQLAQCQASALLISCARRMNFCGFSWSKYSMMKYSFWFMAVPLTSAWMYRTTFEVLWYAKGAKHFGRLTSRCNMSANPASTRRMREFGTSL